METQQMVEQASRKTFIKGLVTAGLILLMLIPTAFISDLVHEREKRQKEVAAEVSRKWASAQTLTGPFLHIPYRFMTIDAQKKPVQMESHFTLLPEELNIDGTIGHETRRRSIYKVLLYRSNIKGSGRFIIRIPRGIEPADIIWEESKLCFGLSDFKGIEEKIVIQFNESGLEMSPGLPSGDIATEGLSSQANLTANDIGKSLSYSTNIRIKGSDRLHFVPLAGNSVFTLQSTWPNPSFDGNNIPGAHIVNDTGFSARWTFNKANLPFGTLLKDVKFDIEPLAFGVTMVEPADQYAKTERTIKYAILVIGLSFSLFFIVELMQSKPVHPVQYVLIGLALVIFYTLLLAISEFLLFDIAYGIAAAATIILITFYAYSHFRSWKTAAIFSTVLLLLYGFIFVLIRLQDTALLVGSIGLFIILSIAMYASRKINWYGRPAGF